MGLLEPVGDMVKGVSCQFRLTITPEEYPECIQSDIANETLLLVAN